MAYSPTSKFSAALSLHIGLSRDPLGRWHPHAESVVGYGGIYARAFEDGNGNGLKDPREEWIENPAFAVNGSGGPNNEGPAQFNDRLPADRYAYVSLQEGSLDDPLARPSTPGYKLLPRAGMVATLEVPVVLYGQINGTANIEEKAALRPLAGISVELLGGDGKVIKAERSAYDGVFSLDGVKPGTYTLRLSPPELETLGLQSLGTPEIQIEPTGTILDDVNLLATPKENKPPNP